MAGFDWAWAGVLVTATKAKGWPGGIFTEEGAYTFVHPGCAATDVTVDQVTCCVHGCTTPTRHPIIWVRAAGVKATVTRTPHKAPGAHEPSRCRSTPVIRPA